jgi:hypothetical protein
VTDAREPVNTFTVEWLRLREPTDARARSRRLAEAVASRLPADSVTILDLACGTGANTRYLARVIPRRHRWLLLDNDALLLAAIPELMSRRDPTLDERLIVRRADLRSLERSLFADAGLVTASALLDLVSAEWMSGLAASCRQARAVVLFALTYDGRIECTPEDPYDGTVRTLVNRHQETDKGFGPAAGPRAVDAAAACLAAQGYHVERERSDWELGNGDADLQRRLIEGWAAAAREAARERSVEIGAWQERRLKHLGEGRSLVRVGHEDVAGWL